LQASRVRKPKGEKKKKAVGGQNKIKEKKKREGGTGQGRPQKEGGRKEENIRGRS